MPKKTTAAFYAVNIGRSTGVFPTWEECKTQVDGFQGAKYKKFTNAADAEQYSTGSSPVKASVTTPTKKSSSSSATVTSPGNKGKKRARSPDIEDESGWDVVYCDGACKGNGQAGSVAGVGVWWGEGDKRNIAERCPGDQTNNRAELIAILRILETTNISKTPLLIKSDSDYSISCFKHWLPNWIANNFRTANKAPVKNAPLIRYIAARLDQRARYGQRVRLQHVKGHSGDVGNDGADALANRGATMPSMPERNWEALEKSLKAMLSARAEEDGDGKVEPVEFRDDVGGPMGSPPKMRKVEMRTIQEATREPETFVVPKPPVVTRAPLFPIAAHTVNAPIVARPHFVKEEDIDPELYADCLLDDDELQNEIDD